MHESYHWPEFVSLDEYSNPQYNCIQYELSDGAHIVMSADAKGIHASGTSAEESVRDFCLAIKTRLQDKQGGVYPGTSDFMFQDRVFRSLEQEWMNDKIEIIQKHHVTINILGGYVLYSENRIACKII